MKLWITGAGGMLGRDLSALVHKLGYDLTCTGREVDITDPRAVSSYLLREKPTHIVNCAAYTAVDKAETEFDLAFKVNAFGPEVLGREASLHGVKVCHVSTDYVFQGDDQKAYVEQDFCGPLSAYGQSKREGELRLVSATNGAATIVRTSWLFGVHGRCFPSTMLSLMKEKERIRVVSDQYGRPTFTPDLAKALIGLCERTTIGTYHFANSGVTTWHGFALVIAERGRALGHQLAIQDIDAIRTVDYPTPAVRPAWSVLSTDKIEQTLGYKPRPWTAALDDWYADFQINKR